MTVKVFSKLPFSDVFCYNAKHMLDRPISSATSVGRGTVSLQKNIW